MLTKFLSLVAFVALLTGMGAVGVSAQTTTPGTPDTGSGGDSANNIIVLVVSGLVAAGGALYLTNRLAKKSAKK